ncbi:hypothetical protein [Phenylobacterium sp.]|jgi:hypothetical protein|uniref:hypothetical protein n=1 Tax=Phenylobacterium sp. TaxID=1871053 RepID=UPI002F92EA08
MTRSLFVLGLALATLTACASPRDTAPGCRGRLRPANPNGSVLSPGAPAPALSASPAAACLAWRP